MAYHYQSPYQILYDQHWQFVNTGLYEMLPRFLDTSYVLLFSAVHSQVASRMIHFLIFFTGIYTAAAFLKKYVSVWAAILFSFFTLFLNIQLLIESTTGYVDSGTAAIAFLFFITAVGHFHFRTSGYLYAALAFLALWVGLKYRAIGFGGGVFVVVGGAVFLTEFPKIMQFLKERKISARLLKAMKFGLISFSVFLLFGGYWYLKNFIFTGNPIFPFLLPCWGNKSCQIGQGFFGDWATPLSLKNLPVIRDVLFQKNFLFFQVTVVATVLGLFLPLLHRKSIPFLLALFWPLTVLIEILISQHVSGFLPRYFYHWYFLIPLSLSLPWVIPKKIPKIVLPIFLTGMTFLGIYTLVTAGVIIQPQIVIFNDH